MGCDIHPFLLTKDNQIIKLDFDRNYELFGVLFDVRYSSDIIICRDFREIENEIKKLNINYRADDQDFYKCFLTEEETDYHSHCFCTLSDIEIFENLELSERTEKQLLNIKELFEKKNGKYLICCFDN